MDKKSDLLGERFTSMICPLWLCTAYMLKELTSMDDCSVLYSLRCQTARDLARLSLDQSCCSHVRGIMLLSIPPYPAAQPNTWRAGCLLSLWHCCRRSWSVPSCHFSASEEGSRVSSFRVFLMDERAAQGCSQVRHEADEWDQTTTWTGRMSQQHHP